MRVASDIPESLIVSLSGQKMIIKKQQSLFKNHGLTTPDSRVVDVNNFMLESFPSKRPYRQNCATNHNREEHEPCQFHGSALEDTTDDQS